MAGVMAATALLGLALLLRTALVGHAPWSNLHEFSLAFAMALLATYLLLARAYPIAGLAPFAALLAACLVGFGLGLDDRVDALVPALQQPLLLTIHVGSAVVAYAVAGVRRPTRTKAPTSPAAALARSTPREATRRTEMRVVIGRIRSIRSTGAAGQPRSGSASAPVGVPQR
jgi:hypothetical protein